MAQPTNAGRIWRPLLLAVTAFILSVAGAWIPSIWTDEGATVSASTRTLGQLAKLLGNIDAVHGAYYSLMHGWFALVPFSAFTLRLPSAVAVAVTTFLLWRLGDRLGGPALATYAAVLFLMLPRVTWMGMEGRSWAFSTLAAVGATLAIVGWIQDHLPWQLAVWGVVVAVGIYLHLYLVFLVVAHALSVLVLDTSWRRRGAFALVAAVVAAASLPLAFVASGQSAQISEGGGPATWLRQVIVNQNFLGETPLDGQVWRVAAVGLALVGWALAIWGTLRRGSEQKHIAWLALPWLLLPTIAILVWSVLGKDLYAPRYFSFCTPALALLCGRGVAGLARQWQRITAVVLVAALAAPIYLSQRSAFAKSGYDWTVVASYVEHNAATGDGVYFAPVPTTRTISIVYPRPFADLSDLTLKTSAADQGSLGGESRPLSTSLTEASPDVVWAIWRADYIDRAEDVAAFAHHGYTIGRTWEGPRTQIVQFTRP